MRPPSIPQSIPIHEHDNKHIKIMKQCYNTLVEYRETGTNRIVIQLFISLPSRKDFPEYFEIIEKPISMYEIRKRIETGVYADERSCIDDFRLMFNNCKLFNEDLSQIFGDAEKLQGILMKKFDELTIQANQKVEQIPAPSPIRQTTIQQLNSNGHDPSRRSSVAGLATPPATITTNSTSNNVSSTTERPTKRMKKDPDAPKRRLLTGYILYAAEVRKEYVDRHPDQDFGFISRLIGNDWKCLPRDIRSKYDQKALAHNKKIRERFVEQSMATPSTVSLHTPKLSKRKLALQMRMNQTSTPSNHNHDNSMNSTMNGYSNHHMNNSINNQSTINSPYKSSGNDLSHNYSTRKSLGASKAMVSGGSGNGGKSVTIDSTTQTAPIRFVEPSQRRRMVQSDNFRRYIEGMDIPNRDLLLDETTPERPLEPAESWLGSTGVGRHGSTDAALWALRDFMLQDVATMRWSMQPYLCY